MYRMLTFATVAAAVVVSLWLRRRCAWATAGAAGSGGRFPLVEKLAALGMWLCFAAQAATGLCYATVMGKTLSGYPILLHVACGMGLACCLLAVLFLRGEALGPEAGEAPARFSPVQKACMWVLAACTVVLVLSVVIAMLRVWGTHEQHLAIRVHRAAALAALAAGVVYWLGSRRSAA